jgi:hypothetical protein
MQGRGRPRRRVMAIAVGAVLAMCWSLVGPAVASADNPQDKPLVLGDVPWPEIGVEVSGSVNLQAQPPAVGSSSGGFTWTPDTVSTQTLLPCQYVQPDAQWYDQTIIGGGPYALVGQCSPTVSGTYTTISCDLSTISAAMTLTDRDGSGEVLTINPDIVSPRLPVQSRVAGVETTTPRQAMFPGPRKQLRTAGPQRKRAARSRFICSSSCT